MKSLQIKGGKENVIQSKIIIIIARVNRDGSIENTVS